MKKRIKRFLCRTVGHVPRHLYNDWRGRRRVWCTLCEALYWMKPDGETIPALGGRSALPARPARLAIHGGPTTDGASLLQNPLLAERSALDSTRSV